MENHSLREENKRLRSLQSVKRAQEMDAQAVAELEKMLLEASGREHNNKGMKRLKYIFHVPTDFKNCCALLKALPLLIPVLHKKS